MSSNSSKERGESAISYKRVFLCYSHRNRDHASRLRIHFDSCQQIGLTTWDDTQIPAGSLWESEIALQLSTVNFAVLLVSADFLASSFITTFELPQLLSAVQSGGTRILPVIVGHCLFQESRLAVFQAVNNPARPLNCLSTHARDEIWVSVVRSILSASPQQIDHQSQKPVSEKPLVGD